MTGCHHEAQGESQMQKTECGMTPFIWDIHKGYLIETEMWVDVGEEGVKEMFSNDCGGSCSILKFYKY